MRPSESNLLTGARGVKSCEVLLLTGAGFSEIARPSESNLLTGAVVLKDVNLFVDRR